MGYLNIPANGWPQLQDLEKLDKIAQQMGDLPTFTSNDRAFLEALPAMPTDDGKTVLTATTDDRGNTELTYETPEVEGDDIAQIFDDTTAYSEGDIVYYDGVLYKFDADHAAGAWDPAEATRTSVAAEFNQLKNTLITYPDYADQTLILDANTTYPYTYTAPKDGFIIVNRLITNDSGTKLAINGLSIISLSNDMETTGGMYPVRKNDTVIFNGLTTVSRAYFVPFRV